MSFARPQPSSLFELQFPQSVGIYNTYDEAQRAVDYLADEKFEVQNLAIVGTDLKSVERVLGKIGVEAVASPVGEEDVAHHRSRPCWEIGPPLEPVPRRPAAQQSILQQVVRICPAVSRETTGIDPKSR